MQVAAPWTAASGETAAVNRIAGPQIGLRWFKPFGRFALSSEGRFTAGINSQVVHQSGVLGSTLVSDAPITVDTPDIPKLMRATGFNNSENFTEFSPLVEFRIEAHVEITRLISLKAGWNAIWVNGIARAADMVEYRVPDMGITTALGGNRQDVFMHGLNLGIELNR